MIQCPYCGSPMRATMMVGHPPQPDGWNCAACSKGSSHEMHVGLQITGSLKSLGWQTPCGRDPSTGERLTMIDMHLRYHQAMIVIAEMEARST